MKYLKYIKQFDFLSTEAKLTCNIKGETRIKTIIGGFISVLSVIVSTSLTLYFFIRFVAKNNKTLISSSQYSPNVNFTFSNKLPIMMRLSSQENQAYDNPESIYKIKMISLQKKTFSYKMYSYNVLQYFKSFPYKLKMYTPFEVPFGLCFLNA